MGLGVVESVGGDLTFYFYGFMFLCFYSLLFVR